MTGPTPALTVLLAPPGPAAGVRSALQDWSAAGLVSEFLWVEPAAVDVGDSAALWISRGRVYGTSVRAAIADRSPGMVRLCVIVPMLDGTTAVPLPLEQALAQIVDGALGRPALRIRVVVARPGQAGTGTVAREGWHNVVLAPEDADGPAATSVPLPPSTDATDLGLPVAVSIAGLTGLWTAVGEGALDGTAPPPGESARIALSYYRRLDGGTVEDALRRAVLSTDAGFPRPVTHGRPAVHIEEVGLASHTMARAAYDRHRHLLKGPRDNVQPAPVQPIGARDAIRMFFGFLLAALRNAPALWAARVRDRMAAGVARRVHQTVFGSAPSAYSVVVSGMSHTGAPASWAEIGAAAGAVDDVLDQAGLPRTHEGHADLGGLWRDFVGGGLTLADGGVREASMPPVQVDSNVGVMRSPEAIVPTQPFRGVAGQLAASVEDGAMSAFDVLGIYGLQRRLEQQAQQVGIQLEASKTLDELRRWRDRARPSYAVQFGELIGTEILSTEAEVRDLLSKLSAAAGSGDLGAEEEARQRRLSRRLKIITGVIVLGIAAFLVVAGLGWLSWLWAVLGVIGCLVFGSLAMMRTFYVGQRSLFQFLTRQREAARAAEVAARNLRQALRDLRRLIDAYGQYLVWARVLGVLVSQPFGVITAAPRAEVSLAGPLPRTMKLGIAEVDDSAVTYLAALIRRDVFGPGWLSGPWENLLGQAAQRLGPDAVELADQPQALYGRTAVAVGGVPSLLTRWGDLVARDGIDQRSADRLWADIRGALENRLTESAVPVLGRIRLVGDARDDRLDVARFLAGVGAQPVGTGRALDPTLLSAAMATSDQSRVVTSRVVSRVFGLSRLIAMTDFSAPIRSYDYRFGAVAAPDFAGPNNGAVAAPTPPDEQLYF